MSPVRSVLTTLSYVQKFSGQTILVKLGGAVLQDSYWVESICKDLHSIRSVGVNVVVVHGGGPAINEELKARGIEWQFVDGQRVTTPAMMEIIEMVLCGLVNRRVVRALNQAGVRSVGISGSDAGTLVCRQISTRLGQVGFIDQVDGSIIHSILKEGIPVIAPIGVGKEGEVFNINADWAASRIAQALGITKMLFLTDQDGILDSHGNLIGEIDAADLETLIETGIVTGGMLAKTQTVLSALRNGVSHAHILNAKRPHALIEELFTEGGIGTICRLRSRVSNFGKEKPYV